MARRPGTIANHNTAVKSYMIFCSKFKKAYKYPDPPTICIYIEHMSKTLDSPNSIINYVGAIKVSLKKMGCDISAFDNWRVKEALNTIKFTI